ncbi:Transcriptional regulatory protein pro1 [Fulvia fulva]|nr:Transcriptional regulatory protein pro1 [Fulvia fulva]WPV19581.1 Transcriptional regulatory protein pro1 [Fulvia fulva]WPV34381.1 Transcriptional regulatory protein pro1 [Fulvia fulva]
MSSSAQPSGVTKQTSKMAAPKNVPSAEAKAAASKMHRRSRSGCFTCRLRRKKCEEGKPACKACKHLGLRCDYKRPMWWSNGEQRRQQKEMIKNIIKRTQLSKKQAQAQQSLNTSSPPPLSHSVPTSAEAPFAESFPQSRCPSEGSPYSDGCDYTPGLTPAHGFTYQSPEGYFAMPPPPQPFISAHPQYPMFSPYEVDIKTEREIYINNVPTRRDSTISTFSTFQPPPAAEGVPGYPADSWVQQEHFESTCEEFAEEPVDFNFFEYPHGPLDPDHGAVINVDEADKYLFNHFLDKVTKLIFPVLDANQHGSARTDVILPALESNQAYLHCCLSIAATHMRSTEGVTGEQIDNDIVRHRYSAISALCEALGQDVNHAQILEATLGMIFFQCSVGRPDDALPDIPWHQHFQAAASLVNKLELPASAMELSTTGQHPDFNMTLASWIDILGASLMNRQPMFAETYRAIHEQQGSIGLAELTGCEDNIMFLISEGVCLEVNKPYIDDVAACNYVTSLSHAITATEAAAPPVQNCFSSTGAIRPRQLTANISALFRVALRIYLLSLVPGNLNNGEGMVGLIGQFSKLMNFIPAGPEGFDRSVAWPLLIAGGSSIAGDSFRTMFDDRCRSLGDAANFGSFGRIRELLKELWSINDTAAAQGDFQGARWRDVMQQKGWEFLLM